jgi:ceramide glucosyltransferase
LILVASGLTLYLAAYCLAMGWMWYTRHRAKRAASAAAGNFLPPVTIFKPLEGLDESLEVNLESFAQLDYPTYQLIFCCRNASDPALRVARRLADRYPQLDILFLNSSEADGNPKILNLQAMLPYAKHEFCLISDSNVRIGRGDLRKLVPPFRDPDVGLVYQPVVGIAEQTPAAAIENLRLTEYAGLLSVASKLLVGVDVVMGKGMLLRRTALADVGGFEALRDICAEDYVLATRLKKAGWKLHMATVPVRAVHTKWSLASVCKRHIRHGAMRWRLCVWAYPLELLTNPVATGLILPLVFGWLGFAAWLGVVVIKTTLELTAAAHLRGQSIAWKYVPLVLAKDLLMFGVWIAALMSSRVNWRGRIFRLGRGTRLIRVDAAGFSRAAASASASHVSAS